MTKKGPEPQWEALTRTAAISAASAVKGYTARQLADPRNYRYPRGMLCVLEGWWTNGHMLLRVPAKCKDLLWDTALACKRRNPKDVPYPVSLEVSRVPAMSQLVPVQPIAVRAANPVELLFEADTHKVRREIVRAKYHATVTRHFPSARAYVIAAEHLVLIPPVSSEPGVVDREPHSPLYYFANLGEVPRLVGIVAAYDRDDLCSIKPK